MKVKLLKKLRNKAKAKFRVTYDGNCYRVEEWKDAAIAPTYIGWYPFRFFRGRAVDRENAIELCDTMRYLFVKCLLTKYRRKDLEKERKVNYQRIY